MIAIPPEYIESCLYIYSTKEDAQLGRRSGGSGLTVGVKLERNPSYYQNYIVTCWHVIEKFPNPTVRINLRSGGFDCLETNLARWTQHPEGDDLAVLAMDFEAGEYRTHSILTSSFVNEAVGSQPIVPGDQVFMPGRFTSVEGILSNRPSLRFGNIAMMPGEPIADRRGVPRESFLVEHRSLPGYSGSPVFVWIDPTMPRPPYWANPALPTYCRERHGPWLLA